MSVVSVAVSFALATISPVSQDGLVDAGVERNRHVLVSSGGVPDRPAAPFLATLFAIPLNWPANSSAYEVWIAEFDCSARSRTMKFKTVFSGRRDPVRTEIEHAPVERGGRAVEAQLNLLCGSGETARTARRSYNNVGEFTRQLRE